MDKLLSKYINYIIYKPSDENHRPILEQDVYNKNEKTHTFGTLNRTLPFHKRVTNVEQPIYDPVRDQFMERLYKNRLQHTAGVEF